MPSPAVVRALFRAILREGRKFPSYNTREYITRRAADGFREHKGASPEAVPALLDGARSDLALIKRQSILYGLFGNKFKNVLELDKAKAAAARLRG